MDQRRISVRDPLETSMQGKSSGSLGCQFSPRFLNSKGRPEIIILRTSITKNIPDSNLYPKMLSSSRNAYDDKGIMFLRGKKVFAFIYTKVKTLPVHRKFDQSEGSVEEQVVEIR